MVGGATALVLGAGGFIGTHLTRRLKSDGFFVRGVDLHKPEFAESHADEFVIADLRESQAARHVVDRPFDEVYQLAADMGGAEFIFTGENDADILHNSVSINLNVLDACRRSSVRRIFYSSSACVYRQENQNNLEVPITAEASAYPANPDSEYGWEKLFGERLYFAYARNFGLECRIARYHNVYGPEGCWVGGREKVPAAICRKVIEAPSGGSVEIIGDGTQMRSFLYIDACIEGTLRLMRSAHSGPFNIGSDEMVSINELALIVMEVAGKCLELCHVPGPIGVRRRSSDNRLILEKLGWEPKSLLRDGIRPTYHWIEQMVAKKALRINA